MKGCQCHTPADLLLQVNSSPMRSGSVLTAPSFSSPGRGVSTRPGPPKRSSRCQAATRMGCEPCGRREAAICAAGSSWGPVGRLLALLCVSSPAALAPVSLMSRASIHTAAPPNRFSTLGHPKVPVADRPDAFEGRCSTGLSGAHVRNADHPAQPHGIVTTLRPWAC